MSICDDIRQIVHDELGVHGGDAETLGSMGADRDLCRVIEERINELFRLKPPLRGFVTPDLTIGDICNEVNGRS